MLVNKYRMRYCIKCAAGSTVGHRGMIGHVIERSDTESSFGQVAHTLKPDKIDKRSLIRVHTAIPTPAIPTPIILTPSRHSLEGNVIM